MRPAPKFPGAPGLGWTKDFMRRQSSSRALMGRISCEAHTHTHPDGQWGLHPACHPIHTLPSSSATTAVSPAPLTGGYSPINLPQPLLKDHLWLPTAPQAGIQCSQCISGLTFQSHSLHLPRCAPNKA